MAFPSYNKILNVKNLNWDLIYSKSKMPMVLIFRNDIFKEDQVVTDYIENLPKKFIYVTFLDFKYSSFKKMCDKMKIKSYPVIFLRWNACNRIRIYFKQKQILEARLSTFQIISKAYRDMIIKERKIRLVNAEK